MHGRVVVHCQNDYALSRVCPRQEDAACRPERGHGCPVSRVVAAHGVHGDKRRLRQRRAQQAGGQGLSVTVAGDVPGLGAQIHRADAAFQPVGVHAQLF